MKKKHPGGEEQKRKMRKRKGEFTEKLVEIRKKRIATTEWNFNNLFQFCTKTIYAH